MLSASDIPKLEQLIISRLRSIVQDRFVHPKHLSLALPRILNPSVSPTPVLSDIGDGAVQAMSDAVREGMGRMVDDLGGLVGVAPGAVAALQAREGSRAPAVTSASARASRASSIGSASVVERDVVVGGSGVAPPSVHIVQPTSPARPAAAAGRKIAMPQGMSIGGGPLTPGGLAAMQGPYGSGSVTPTVPGHLPLTPGPHSHGQGGVGLAAGLGAQGGSSATTGGYTSAISAGGAASSRGPPSAAETSSYAPGQSHFRFRGQFATGAASSDGGEAPSTRRVGALNSRAT